MKSSYLRFSFVTGLTSVKVRATLVHAVTTALPIDLATCLFYFEILGAEHCYQQQRFHSGIDPHKASAQAATTGATSDTVTAEQEKLLGIGQSSLVHPTSQPHDPSAEGHQQQQQQQQQQQVTIQTSLQDSMAAAPAETHVVGEELDDRASTAAPLLQHTHAGIMPPTTAGDSVVHMHKPASSLLASNVVGEEQDPKASAAASAPDVAVKAIHELEQPPTSQRPKSNELPTAHTRDAEAVDDEDGEVPSVARDGHIEAVQKAADAVVGEELHSKAATTAAGTDALRTASGLAANSQHQALHGKALTELSVCAFHSRCVAARGIGAPWRIGVSSRGVRGQGSSLGHNPRNVLAVGRMRM